MKTSAMLLKFLAALSAMSVVLGLLGKWHYLLDMCSHFRVQVVCTLLFCGLSLLLLRHRRWAVGCLLLGTGLLLTVVDPWEARSAPSANQYRLLALNVLTMNPRHDRIVRCIRDADPDFIALMEIDSAWDETLEVALDERWPYHKSVPRSDNFGIAIFSKLPWESCDIVEYAAARTSPVLSANFRLAGGDELRLIAIHPVSPMTAGKWQSRNSLFAKLGKDVQAGEPSRTIVAGDFNCTPWSYWFGRLLEESDLRSASGSPALQITWMPIPVWLFGLPLDHVLVGSKIRISRFSVGPYVGSDHRPVIVDFDLGATKKPVQSGSADHTGM